MSYSLTPVIVDLRKVRKLAGSKDEGVLRTVMRKCYKEFFGLDETFDSDFDTFKKQIRDEYKAFFEGDYSGVDLAFDYPEPEKDDDEDLDEEDLAFKAEYERLKDKNPKAADKLMKDYLKKAFEETDWDDVDDDEEEEEQEPQRETSTGAALVHLILGGNPDPSVAYKYGYALFHLCQELGQVPDHDTWCSIRSRTLDEVDSFLKKAGIKSKAFSVDKFLISRGPPVKMPRPDDFPSIGYLDREEIPDILALLDPERLESAFKKQDAEDREWLEEMIGELRSWLETCVRSKLDLVCFYF